MFLSLLLFGAVAAVPNAQQNAPFKVTLPERQIFTRDNGDADPLLIVRLNDTLKKYHSNVQLPTYPVLNALLGTALEKRQSNEPLTDQTDGVSDDDYYGPIIIGQQKFTVGFDTGSSDLIIPGPQCTIDVGCTHATKYSQTGVDRGTTTTVAYGSGQAIGENYFDNVTVAGLTAQNQGLVSLTEGSVLLGLGSDGLLGLAFKAYSASRSTPFFENLIAQKRVKKPEFSFYLGRVKSDTLQNSELTLGGRDTRKFTGSPTVVAVTKQGYWQVALDSVSVNGRVSPRSKGQAAIDTGTTLIIVPSLAAFAMILQIPDTVPIALISGADPLTMFAYPCNTDPKYIPVIRFAGVKFPINAHDFNFGLLTEDFAESIGNRQLIDLLKNSSKPYCLSAIVAFDVDLSQNLYVVGDAFLKNWYSIYSYTAGPGGKPAVLFAKSVN